MCEYTDDADCVYSWLLWLEIIGMHNTFEERFICRHSIQLGKAKCISVYHRYVSSFGGGAFDLSILYNQGFAISFLLSEYFKLLGENYPLHRMMVIMVGCYTAGNFLNILYIFLYLIFTKSWWGRDNQYCYLMDRETETHRNLWTYPSWSL